MESKILKETNNSSLKRKEYLLEILAEKNPTKQEVGELIKGGEEVTVVKKIEGSFGKDTFLVDVVVYDSKEDKNKYEILSRKAKKKLAEEAKKAAESVKTE